MRFISFLLIIIAVSSCKSYKTKYPYSLKDFRTELRPGLEKIIIGGGTCVTDYDDDDNARNDKFISLVDSSTTEQELQKLIVCEHPILRAYAFNVLCRRESPLVNNILLNHLDDTAIISYCRGEFGPDYTTVSDYFLDRSEGKTTLLKKDIIAKVIKEYPYLEKAAFLFFSESDFTKQYHKELKDIIQKDYPWHYNRRKDLLFSLSEYKNNDDTSLIKEHLESNWGKDAGKKFWIAEKNPISSYFFVIEKFYKSLLSYKYQGVLEAQYQRDQNFELIFDRFINATAAYKSKRSAGIIKNLIQENLYPNNPNNKDKLFEYNFHYSLLKTLEQYDCDFYADIKKEILPKAKAYEKKYALSSIEVPAAVIIEKSKFW